MPRFTGFPVTDSGVALQRTRLPGRTAPDHGFTVIVIESLKTSPSSTAALT